MENDAANLNVEELLGLQSFLGIKICLHEWAEKGVLIPNPLEDNCYLLHPDSIDDLKRAIRAHNLKSALEAYGR